MLAFVLGVALAAGQIPRLDAANADVHYGEKRQRQKEPAFAPPMDKRASGAGNPVLEAGVVKDVLSRGGDRVRVLAPCVVTGVPSRAETEKDAQYADCAEEQGGKVAEGRHLIGSTRNRIARVERKARARGGYLGSIVLGGAYLFACLGWILMLIGRSRTVRAYGTLLLALGVWMLLYVLNARI